MLASTQSQACLLMILQTSYSPPSLGQASHLEPLTKELELQTQIACKQASYLPLYLDHLFCKSGDVAAFASWWS